MFRGMGKNFCACGYVFLKSKSMQAKNVKKVCQNRLFKSTYYGLIIPLDKRALTKSFCHA